MIILSCGSENCGKQLVLCINKQIWLPTYCCNWTASHFLKYKKIYHSVGRTRQ